MDLYLYQCLSVCEQGRLGYEGGVRNTNTDGQFHAGRGLHHLAQRGHGAGRHLRPGRHADQGDDRGVAGRSGQR